MEMIGKTSSRMNHKGWTPVTNGLFVLAILAFVGILTLGIFMYMSAVVNGALDKNIQVGQVNLSNATKGTFGKFNGAVQTQSNTLGIMILFGMVLGMLFNAYLYRDENIRVFWMIDFLLLIGALIISVYLSNQYVSIVQTLPFSSYYTSGLTKPTLFMTYLPYIVTVTGVLAMVLGYSGVPRTKGEVLQIASPY